MINLKRPGAPESSTPEYLAWKRAIDRCTNPKNKKYKCYGGRGIKVCARWMVSYADFLADVGRKPRPELSLDRIENDGDYEPGNVRWGTWEQQNNNRRSHRIFVEVAGTKVPLAKIARSSGLPYSRILRRLRRGWSIDRAICVPVRRNEIPGICKHKRDGTWAVRITLQGKRVHIGTYRTFAEAAEAYRSVIGSAPL